jgi:hypothetical protein
LDRELETGEGKWKCKKCEFINFNLYRFADLDPKVRAEIRQLNNRGVSIRKPVDKDLPYHGRSKQNSFLRASHKGIEESASASQSTKGSRIELDDKQNTTAEPLLQEEDGKRTSCCERIFRSRKKY